MASLAGSRFPLRPLCRLRPVVRSPARRFGRAQIPSQGKGGQDVFIQKVRVRSRWFRPRNLAITFAVAYFCLQTYKVLVIEPLVDWLDDELENQGPEAVEEPLEPLFIAFPFTTRKTESLPYRGSDPEWQEYIRIAKDKNAQQKIRHELAGLVKLVAQTTTLLAFKVGKDMKIRRYWLDLDYPYRPPPEFTRTGMEVTEEGWEVVERPVDHGTVMRINRTLFPSPILLSTFTFTGALLKQLLANAAAKLGFEIKPGPAIPQVPTGGNVNQTSGMSRELRQLHQQSAKRSDTVKDPRALTAKWRTSGGSATDAAGDDSAGTSAGDTAAESKEGTQTPPSPPTQQRPEGEGRTRSVSPIDTGQESILDSLPGYSSLRAHILRPWYEAKMKYKQTWKPPRQLPPRGCVLVSGLVELETAKAIVLIEVAGWWNPKARKFDVKSMFMGLKRVQMRQQAPLR